jgi:hypothetical protein
VVDVTPQAGTLVSNTTWWEARYGADSLLYDNGTVAVQGNTVSIHTLPAPSLSPRWRIADEWVDGSVVTAAAALAPLSTGEFTLFVSGLMCAKTL